MSTCKSLSCFPRTEGRNDDDDEEQAGSECFDPERCQVGTEDSSGGITVTYMGGVAVRSPLEATPPRGCTVTQTERERGRDGEGHVCSYDAASVDEPAGYRTKESPPCRGV